MKAIVALGAFGMLCEMRGDQAGAKHFKDTAAQMAQQWQKMAADGDHYRLAFDRSGTWSQKYNLVWDRLLDLKLFPENVARTEVAFYLQRLNEFGLPLDNRAAYTKADWVVWSATLAGSQQDFARLFDPLYRFIQRTPDRMPLTDWYDTKNAKGIHFRARPVIGGVFVKLLADEAVWKKWSSRAASHE